MENFNEIYSKNHKSILTHINKRIHDLSLAEELTNDVFMKLHKHLHNFDSEKATMSTWIYNIANNTIIDHYRKVKKLMLSLNAEMDNDSENKTSFIDTVSHPSNPHKEMVTTETLSSIQTAITSLNAKYRDVAILYFNDDLSYDEICVRLNLPLGTVKGQINRARKKLVSKLEKVRV